MFAFLLTLVAAEAKTLKFPDEIATVEAAGEIAITVERLGYGKDHFDVDVRIVNKNDRAAILLAGDFRCGRGEAKLPLLPSYLLSGATSGYGVITSPAKEADEDYPSASSLLRRVDHLAEIPPLQDKTIGLVCRYTAGETGSFVVTLGRVFRSSPDDIAVPIDLRIELPEASE